MLALHQEANPELTEDIKALTAKGPVHQKPSTSARAAGLRAGSGPNSTSPAKETFLQKFLCLQQPQTNVPQA